MQREERSADIKVEWSQQVNSPVSDFPKLRCDHRIVGTPLPPFVEYLHLAVKVLDSATTGERPLQSFPNASLVALSNVRAG